MVAQYGARAVFVDGRIDLRLVGLAAESGNIKGFFNQRFHDKRVDWQRLVYFQTKSTRRWGERKRGIANLHFHALIILPERQSLKQIRRKLGDVFGHVAEMGGKIQFKITKPDWSKSYTFGQVTATGPLGKILYVQSGIGATYNDLKLNDEGKRSRKAPIERLRCNRQAKGLARGIPSHFNAKATLCDHASTAAGRVAFREWVAEERRIRREKERRTALALNPLRKDDLCELPANRRA